MKPLDTAPPLVLVTWEDATLLDVGAWADNKDHKYSPKRSMYLTNPISMVEHD